MTAGIKTSEYWRDPIQALSFELVKDRYVEHEMHTFVMMTSCVMCLLHSILGRPRITMRTCMRENNVHIHPMISQSQNFKSISPNYCEEQKSHTRQHWHIQSTVGMYQKKHLTIIICQRLTPKATIQALDPPSGNW
jgi:hypothetical protein